MSIRAKLGFGVILNIIIRISLLYFLGEVSLFPEDPRFDGKAIPIRNIIIVLSMSLVFPFLYFVKKRWKKYPFWLDNIYLSIFWLDMAGNSLDLYDTYFYFDLFPHVHGTGAIAAVFFGAFGLAAMPSIALANGIHLLLEAQEIFTDVFFGTHNVRGAFDTINDIIVGIIGTVLYVGTAMLWKNNWHRKFLMIIVVVLAGALLLGMFFHRSVATHAKALLLLSAQFPQIPVKPLTAITLEPSYEQVTLDTKNGKVVMDIVFPKKRERAVDKLKKPVLILAMGVKTSEKDKVVIMDFAKQLARIGYIVLWPRLETLNKGISGFERPETFIAAFRHAEAMEQVDKERISFVGFSIGSSIAFVAAANFSIADKVHGQVFFGGYYDVFAYLRSVATRSIALEGWEASWEPAEGVITHLREIAQETKSETLGLFAEKHTLEEVDEILKTMPKREIETFKRLSPKEHLAQFKTPIFILHEKSDTFVPYSESIKLYQALPQDIVKKFTVVNLFEHVQPKEGFSTEIIGEFYKLYGFLYEALRYL